MVWMGTGIPAATWKMVALAKGMASPNANEATMLQSNPPPNRANETSADYDVTNQSTADVKL